jgi:hypothetical protein
VDIKEGGKIITIKGIVIPVDWDEKGTVIAAALSTHKEEEYLIEHNDEGRKLMAFIQHEVKVSGVVRKNPDKKTITISTYEVIRE